MNDQQTIEATKQLVAIPSSADNPAALQDAVTFVADLLAGTPGITIERFESNGKPSLLAYKGSTRPEMFAILLHAHVDVVPAEPQQFVPAVRDGKLYGRGVHDMKAATVVMADVFCRLVNSVPYALGLQVVADEEVGGYDGAYYQIQQGVRTAFAITGEHNFQDDAIYNASRGICWTEISFSGKDAHGGYVWHGSNAVMKASDFAQAILKRYPTPDSPLWGTTANIAGMHTTNTAYNRVPDNAILKVDFRFTAEDPNFKDRASVEAFVHSIDPQATIEQFVTMEQAVHVDEHNPYLQLLGASLQQTIGKPPVYLSRSAGSDARHYATVTNDVVEYGITGEGPHSDHEHIDLHAIAPYRQTLERFLVSAGKLAPLDFLPAQHGTRAASANPAKQPVES